MKAMISAKIFLVGMYLHLALSIFVPVCIIAQGEWTSTGVQLLLFYLVMMGAVHLMGWVSVVMAVVAVSRGQEQRVRRSWRLLKLGAIPFYLLNFIYSVLAWLALIGASRGLMALLLPIPVVFTCLLVVESGCVGICWLRYLNSRFDPRFDLPGVRVGPHPVHYLLQLLPVADVLSTFYISRKYRDGQRRAGAAPL